MNALLTWPQAFAAGVAQAGGKGWNLARLARYGFPVPPGGVLPVSAWTRFAAYNGLDAADASAEQVAMGRMPPDLVDDIAQALDRLGLGEECLAVRSSAVAEDGATASFAGIHESVLNVRKDGVPAAIVRCWASAFGERARAYRQRMGLDQSDVAPAIVIQRLVIPRAAGVAFSLDPATGRRDRVLVAANAGLGETVVNGSAEPDQYLVDSGFHGLALTVLTRQVGRKQSRVVPLAQGGTATENSAAAGLCLDAAVVLDIARLVLRVRWALGHDEVDQDVEWVWDGTDVQLVQARPVTAHKRWTYPGLRGQAEVWSNGNLRDGIPEVMTPMTWSLTAHPLHAILPTMHRAARVAPMPGLSRMRLVDGRAYLDASLMQWEYWDAFGTPPALFNRLLGGHQQVIDVPKPSPWQMVRWLRANVRLVRSLGRARKRAEQEFARMRKVIDDMRDQDCSGLTDRELIERLNQFSDSQDDRSIIALLLMSSGATLYMLRPLLERFLPGRGGAVAHALLAEQAAITSAEHGRALAGLAAMAVAEGIDDVAAWAELPAQSRFRQGFEDFLQRWGHRGVYELEAANPRWREDPSWLLDTIRALMAAPPAVHGRGGELAEQAWAEVEKAVPRWLQGIIRRMAAQAGRDAAHREEAKSIIVRAYEPARLAVLELGRRLTARGVIRQCDDVFLLTWEEVDLLLAGRWSGEGARALIFDRAERMQALAAQPAPDMVVVEAGAIRRHSVKAGDGPVLHGSGVASGVVRGRVRIILHPQEGHRLQPGEILVAPSTDPAWTPLFLRAAAVVMETGGVLSHGAIVAREYGLPAVVNVCGVLDRLRDGMELTVDGDNGVVTIEAE
ncbi:MAG: PEP/pyruvate-binding domain-containing protein [Bacteroidota bacterium]